MFLAILVHLLVLLLLLRLAPELPFAEPKGKPSSFELLPEQGQSQATATEARQEDRQAGGASKATPSPPKPPPPEPPPVEAEPVPVPKVEYIRLTQAELRSTDRVLATRSSSTSANSNASAAASGPGPMADAGGASGSTGPNGERLYPADWYRKPTHAELGMYLPAGVSGWGMIACRTVKDYRVEDCRELDQSPPGSGLSRAIRQAAWQFRVLPPRVGGKPQVGAWVRIRIDYVKGEVK